MDNCLNPDLQKQTSAAGSGNISNLNGEYTLAAIDKFDEEFRRSIVSEASTNVLTDAVNKFGQDFYSSLSSLNNDFLKRDYVRKDIEDLELLSYRLNGDRPITAFEYAQFLKEYNYTPYTAQDSWGSQSLRFSSQLDSFYRGSFQQSILGSFCAGIGSIFAAIDSFFDLVGEIEGLITDVFAFLNKIKNIEDPIKALFEKIKVKALIEAIKKKVKDAVKGVIEKVQKMIENFSLENIMGQIETFVNEKIVKRVNKLKDDILAFFDEDNKNSIFKKIEGLVDYAVGVFENPSIEEIMLLVYKFCSFVTGVEGLINGLKAPLDDFSNRYEEVFNTLNNVSNRTTGEAIRAGAIRYTPEKRKEVINKQQELETSKGEPAPPTVKEQEEVPTWEEVSSGSHPKIKVAGQWVTKLGRAGWDNLDRDVKIKLLRLHDKVKNVVKGPFTINSAWRSVEYNNSVGGAKESQHLSGKAVDITWAGFDPSADASWVSIQALKQGFNGTGFYDTFMHLDTRGKPTVWNNRTSSPIEEEKQSTGLTRRQAYKLALQNKESVEFEENGFKYIAKYTEPSRESRTGVNERGEEITTNYSGIVNIVPVR